MIFSVAFEAPTPLNRGDLLVAGDYNGFVEFEMLTYNESVRDVCLVLGIRLFYPRFTPLSLLETRFSILFRLKFTFVF